MTPRHLSALTRRAIAVAATATAIAVAIAVAISSSSDAAAPGPATPRARRGPQRHGGRGGHASPTA